MVSICLGQLLLVIEVAVHNREWICRWDKRLFTSPRWNCGVVLLFRSCCFAYLLSAARRQMESMESVRRRPAKTSHGEEDAVRDMEATTEEDNYVRYSDQPSSSREKKGSSHERYWVSGMFFTRNPQLWSVVKLSGRVLSSTLGLIILLALFTIIGAIIFVALEGPNETAVRNRISEERKEMLERMWNLTVDNLSLTMEDFVKNGDMLLKAYTTKVVEASQAGISPETESAESPKKWNFWGAIFYCLTVYTTIGYGHIAPATEFGRIITMLYATVGIPLCLVVLVKVGKIFTRILKLTASLVRRTYRRIKLSCRSKSKPAERGSAPKAVEENLEEPPLQPDINELMDLYEQQDSSFDVPIIVALVLVVVYMLLGAALYRSWETWDYTETVYFIFISISTIGFGDVLPEHPKYFLLVSVYIFVGLSLVSMVVNVLMDNMAEKLDQAQEKIKELATKDDAKVQPLEEENAKNSDKMEEAEGCPATPQEREKTKDFILKPELPQRVDKIDLSCIASCAKDD